ncbi:MULTISPECIES: hypothetical protein [unclassified Comamonas]|jgi:hypothetical protein|uniref:Uncharacterized protein n=1 Tax=Comamonas squillarum TaxID=2977320 RepID=A0ABY5ZT87_9BURK|nr:MULTISPECIES: hypothetical protein [unclassified Comamonas]PWB14993.1 hypothetical protein DCO45_20710 [Comamonas sp. JNW]UXC17111.1 hypothetical protein N4T19_15505 [Comamonas sp. PR12]
MKNIASPSVVAQQDDLLVLREPRQALLPASLGWLSAVENAFVRWQAKRLAELEPGRLWAQALQDTRSLAEIRRARR